MANFMTPLVGKNHMQLETLKASASLLKQMQDLKRFEDGGKSSIFTNISVMIRRVGCMTLFLQSVNI